MSLNRPMQSTRKERKWVTDHLNIREQHIHQLYAGHTVFFFEKHFLDITEADNQFPSPYFPYSSGSELLESAMPLTMEPTLAGRRQPCACGLPYAHKGFSCLCQIDTQRHKHSVKDRQLHDSLPSRYFQDLSRGSKRRICRHRNCVWDRINRVYRAIILWQKLVLSNQCWYKHWGPIDQTMQL